VLFFNVYVYRVRPDHTGRRLAHDHIAMLAGWRPAARNAPSRKLYTEATEELGIMLIRQVCNGENVLSDSPRHSSGVMVLAFQWKGPRAVRPWLSGGTIQLGSGDPRDAGATTQYYYSLLGKEDTAYRYRYGYRCIWLSAWL
jgi:hypothetical protein